MAEHSIIPPSLEAKRLGGAVKVADVLTSLRVPFALVTKRVQLIEAHNALGVATMALQDADNGLLAAARALGDDVDDAVARHNATVTLARVRRAEREYRGRRSECDAARLELAAEIAKVVGVCVGCGEEHAADGFAPYCDECAEHVVPF